MAVLVSEAITRIRYAYPDMSSAVALKYINEVHDDLLAMLPNSKTTEDITITAGTQEYALNEDDVRVISAEWFQTANDRIAMRATDVSQLDITSPNWRRISRGRPYRFYIDRNATGNVVGFIPPPIASTSGGYPKATLYVQRTANLLDSDSLPASLSSSDLYVFGACARFCRDKQRDERGTWDEDYQNALQNEVSRTFGRNVQSKPAMIPTWMPRGGTV